MCSVEQRVEKTKRKEEAERLKPSRKTSPESCGLSLYSPSGSQRPLQWSLRENPRRALFLLYHTPTPAPFPIPKEQDGETTCRRGRRWGPRVLHSGGSHSGSRVLSLGLRCVAPLGGRVWRGSLGAPHEGECCSLAPVRIGWHERLLLLSGLLLRLGTASLKCSLALPLSVTGHLCMVAMSACQSGALNWNLQTCGVNDPPVWCIAQPLIRCYGDGQQADNTPGQCV